MWPFIQSKHKSILGVDISSLSVKIIELSLSEDRYCVEAYGSVTLPKVNMNGKLFKDIDVIATSIKHLISTSSFSSKYAALAVPDSSAISKIIQVNDGLSNTEIEELILLESEKHIPFPVDEINMDFNLLGPSPKNAALQDVLLVASRAENVSNRVDILERAGLKAKIVDVESYAMERAAQLLRPSLPSGGDNKVVAIVDIGSIYTRLYVLYNMGIIYSREEEFGGKQLLDGFVQQYGVTPENAQLAIAQGNYPEDYLERVQTPFNELLLLQVKRALQFFFSTSRYSFVDHLILAGGVAQEPGLAHLLETDSGVSTSIADPFSEMGFSEKIDGEHLKRMAPSLMVACGLALRRVE